MSECCYKGQAINFAFYIFVYDVVSYFEHTLDCHLRISFHIDIQGCYFECF